MRVPKAPFRSPAAPQPRSRASSSMCSPSTAVPPHVTPWSRVVRSKLYGPCHLYAPTPSSATDANTSVGWHLIALKQSWKASNPVDLPPRLGRQLGVARCFKARPAPRHLPPRRSRADRQEIVYCFETTIVATPLAGMARSTRALYDRLTVNSVGVPSLMLSMTCAASTPA